MENKFLSKNASKRLSPERAAVQFNLPVKVSLNGIINAKHNLTKDDEKYLKSIYRFNRNENKIKFLSYDYSNKNQFSSETINYKNDKGFRKTFYDYEELIKKYSNHIKSEKLITQQTETNMQEKLSNSKEFHNQRNYDIKIIQNKPFNLSVNNKSKSEKKVTKVTSKFFKSLEKNKELQNSQIAKYFFSKLFTFNI